MTKRTLAYGLIFALSVNAILLMLHVVGRLVFPWALADVALSIGFAFWLWKQRSGTLAVSLAAVLFAFQCIDNASKGRAEIVILALIIGAVAYSWASRRAKAASASIPAQATPQDVA
jgi:hypothetical protein